MHQYHYEYLLNDKNYSGISLHESDKEAVSYYRSLEDNGNLKMFKLKNSYGTMLWNRTYSRKPDGYR